MIKWSQETSPMLMSGSNPNRDAEHRYLARTLWDAATINLVAFEWHNNAQVVKIRIDNYVTRTGRTPYRIGDRVWIDGYGEFTVTDTDYSKNIWIDADYNAVADIAGGTYIYRTRGFRVAEPGTNRFGNADTTASIDVLPAMQDYVQRDWEPLKAQVMSGSLQTQYFYTITGSEAVPRWTFTDNRFSGSVAFVSSDTSAIPFAIGDSVLIQQQQTGWNYTDNVFVNGYVAFTGSTAAPFPANSTIYVTGQTIQPAYGGITSVLSTGSGLVVTNKPWLTDTAVDAGTIYGYARPEYNRVATITNTFVSQSMRWVVTDLAWAGDSVAIGGEMTSATNTKKTTWSTIPTTVTQTIRGNSSKAAEDFVFTGAIVNTGNRFSSIIASGSQAPIIDTETYRHPVQYTDRGYLLAVYDYAAYDGTEMGIQVNTYDVNGTLLTHAEGLAMYPDPANVTATYAWPYGLKDLETLFATTLYSDAVRYYTIQPWSDQDSVPFGNMVAFELIGDCIGLDAHCVMWEDSMGSVTSWPFQYVSQAASDFDRNFWNPYANNTDTLSTTTTDKWRLNSGFIRNADEDAVIRDMLSSTKVWLKTPTETHRVNIVNTEYAYGNRKYGDLTNVTLDVVKSDSTVTR